MASSCSSSSSTDSESDSSGYEVEIGEEEQELQPIGVIQPWRYEPPGRDNNNEEPNMDVSDRSDRLDNTDWCLCEFCQVMDRSEEFICCQEVESVKRLNAEAVENKELEVEPPCITQHPGFSAVCLNTYVLRTAWYQYRQQYGNRAYDGPQHKKNRHIAYRQFVRWCWGFLGKEIRVPLPSCVVSCIRAHFPPPGLEEDFHFTGFLFADE